MERMTWKSVIDGHEDVGLKDGVSAGDAILQLAAYEDTELEPEEVRDAYHKGWKSALDEIAYAEQAGTVLVDIPLLEEYIKLGPIDHLRELAQAEKDGRLVVLPFCVKTLLYEATEKGAWEYEVEQFSIGVEELLIFAIDKCIWYRGGRIFCKDQIGKTVFLTLEEAEAALKKRSEGKQ